jgi:ADP-ribose pyrophosphatase YjhB (NUDIX family)
MFKGKNKIRVKTICIFEHENKLFLSRAWDNFKEDYYYRPIGGTVEFGERTEETIHREIREELNTEIQNLRLYTVVENIFQCDGIAGHEIMFIYRTDFTETHYYQDKAFSITESDGEVFEASWESIQDILDGKIRLVPEGLMI